MVHGCGGHTRLSESEDCKKLQNCEGFKAVFSFCYDCEVFQRGTVALSKNTSIFTLSFA